MIVIKKQARKLRYIPRYIYKTPLACVRSKSLCIASKLHRETLSLLAFKCFYRSKIEHGGSVSGRN